MAETKKEVAEEEFDELLDTPEFPGFHGAATRLPQCSTRV